MGTRGITAPYHQWSFVPMRRRVRPFFIINGLCQGHTESLFAKGTRDLQNVRTLTL
jgi:hypothetical protein